MSLFTLGGWVALSVELGGIKRNTVEHQNYRAVFFKKEADREAFYALSVEMFPHDKFFVGTAFELFCVQHSSK